MVEDTRNWSPTQKLPTLWMGKSILRRSNSKFAWVTAKKAKDINEMKDNLQEKWLKQSNLEELEGCILENSLGCEILVVGLKADILQVSTFFYWSTLNYFFQTTLNEEGMSEQHADLLQFQLREECLKLGAALFYCSGTVPNKNRSHEV